MEALHTELLDISIEEWHSVNIYKGVSYYFISSSNFWLKSASIKSFSISKI